MFIFIAYGQTSSYLYTGMQLNPDDSDKKEKKETKKTLKIYKGSLTVWALYAYFSDSQNAAFELLVWYM